MVKAIYQDCSGREFIETGQPNQVARYYKQNNTTHATPAKGNLDDFLYRGVLTFNRYDGYYIIIEEQELADIT